MSQKIIIPKGTIDPSHITVIEIPNYLHDVNTVVVTTLKKADSTIENELAQNDFNAYPEEGAFEQNEAGWEQNYETQENNEEEGYPSEQQEYYTNEEVENQSEMQQQQEDQERYINFTDDSIRRSKYGEYNEEMRRRMVNKKRELKRLRAERKRMMEGEMETYESAPHTSEGQGNADNLYEVPEDMRGRLAPREYQTDNEMKRRQQQEFERYQPSYSMQPGYARDQSSSRYENENQGGCAAQQWASEVSGFPDAQYMSQAYPRVQAAVAQQNRQGAGQNYVQEDMRQYQKSRSRAAYAAYRN